MIFNTTNVSYRGFNMIYLELSESEEKSYLESFYNSFETGRDFELFLNYFLTTLGFQEVVTTKYVGDNGIDLTCSKSGIDPQGIDTMNYYIQAKRYQTKNHVGAKEIRDLKGSTKRDKQGNVLNNNYINVFITTSSFTNAAILEAESNPNMPTILIDGKTLINMCKDYGIAFSYKPILDKDMLRNIISSQKGKKQTDADKKSETNYLVERNITANDIRARILIIPQIIKNSINDSDSTIDVEINGQAQTLNIDKSHRYLGGITQIYKDCGLINDENQFIQKQSKWKIIDDNIIITIE